MRTVRALAVSLLVFGLGCGSVSSSDDDAAVDPMYDANIQPDAPVGTPDAGAPDANQVPQGAPGNEITSGSGRVSGGNFTLDVQIGHPASQAPVGGGGKTVKGGAVVIE